MKKTINLFEQKNKDYQMENSRLEQQINGFDFQTVEKSLINLRKQEKTLLERLGKLGEDHRNKKNSNRRILEKKKN